MSSEAPTTASPPPSSATQPLLPGAPPLPDPQAACDQPVPPLEPPAPMAVRVQPRLMRLKFWTNRSREMPSWMTSMVLHVTVTVLFASLAVKVSPRANTVIALESTPPAADRVADHSTSITIEPSSMPFESESQQYDGVSMENIEISVESIDEPMPFEVEVISFDSDLELVVKEPLEAPQEASPTLLWESLSELRAVDPASTAPPEPTTASQQGAGAGGVPETIDPADMDDIVARFIQYDIGNLRGEAGSRARKQFMKLGPEAIPALVRGLNRSAEIRASCPVVVISSKLTESMGQTNDRSLLDYAIQNIGRDVPRGAPHKARVDKLQKQFARQYADRQFDQDFARIRPIRNESTAEWTARVKRLYRADFDALALALQNPQPEERSAAWAALAMRERPEFTPAERKRLAALVLEAWPRHSESYRERMHAALTSLAKGSGVNARAPRFHRRQSTASWNQWRQWWIQNGDITKEEAAGYLLRLAASAEEKEAQQLLARTVEKFPGTANAETARHMLTPDAKLALAETLEKQSRLLEARSLYEDIASDMVFSVEAMQANDRLERIKNLGQPK